MKSLFWREPRPFYWKRYISSQMGVAILKCSHSLRPSLILVTTYQDFHMRYHLHSTLKDEKILKIVRHLGLKTCLCRSICPPMYLDSLLPTFFKNLKLELIQFKYWFYKPAYYWFLPCLNFSPHFYVRIKKFKKKVNGLSKVWTANLQHRNLHTKLPWLPWLRWLVSMNVAYMKCLAASLAVWREIQIG